MAECPQHVLLYDGGTGISTHDRTYLSRCNINRQLQTRQHLHNKTTKNFTTLCALKCFYFYSKKIVHSISHKAYIRMPTAQGNTVWYSMEWYVCSKTGRHLPVDYRVDNSPVFGCGSPGSGCSAVISGLEQTSATNMRIQFSISMFC